MRICLGNIGLDKDPFINYRFRLNEVEREILHEHEIQAIADKVFATSRLEQVKDIFLSVALPALLTAM